MNIEKTIKNCEINLNNIKQYDHDPYYVNYFFNEYINSVNDTFNGIFEEGNRDFGLFISEKISLFFQFRELCSNKQNKFP